MLFHASVQIPESFADCLGGLLSVMGQNLSLKLEVVGENSITAAHANRTINWTTPNKRYPYNMSLTCNNIGTDGLRKSLNF